MALLLIPLLWLGAALMCGQLARSKGRPFLPWAIIGLFVGIFGIILVAVLPRESRLCPLCRGRIAHDARVCRHCRHVFRVPLTVR